MQACTTMEHNACALHGCIKLPLSCIICNRIISVTLCNHTHLSEIHCTSNSQEIVRVQFLTVTCTIILELHENACDYIPTNHITQPMMPTLT